MYVCMHVCMYVSVYETIARVGAILLHRSARQEELLRDVMQATQSGGLPAVGYAVTHEGRVMWALALPCGIATLLTPFPVVPWRNMASFQEVTLGWVCTRHTHPASMNPQPWQARAMVSYLSRALPIVDVTWGRWWDRAPSWAHDGGSVAACPDVPREPVAFQPWTLSLYLLTVAPRLVVEDPEARSLEEETGFR